jgi:pyrroline-5-carboxylate reductase
VFLAVIPQIAKDVIPTMTFAKTQTIISVIAALAIDDLVPLVHPVPATQICRAIPLPAVAVHKGATIISQHSEAERIFNLLGTAIIARDPKEFDVLMCISCMMGPFYKTCDVLSNWFVNHGVAPTTASSLTIAFHHTVLSEAEHRVQAVPSPKAFVELVSEQTPGE